jgi:O-antigen ligase
MIPAASVDLVVSLLPNEVTAGLTQKSWNNSREMHWQARWDEFLSSPFTGVGFATAWEDTIGVDDETGAVETGSSYLAMLSMTGYVGGVACLLLALSLAMRLLACWPILTERQRLEIGSSASFWLVHLGAEGYIYAVASLLGLTFWLWLGCLNDELHAVTALRDTRKFCGLTSAPRWTANPGRVIL